jgi:2-polyprenyl-6-methoxyphenol hydroxylase-like FAD-dependent oxidoreductase
MPLVIVVGGGPVGLSAALTLMNSINVSGKEGDDGVRSSSSLGSPSIVVLEKATGPRTTASRAAVVWRRTAEQLSSFGRLPNSSVDWGREPPGWYQGLEYGGVELSKVSAVTRQLPPTLAGPTVVTRAPKLRQPPGLLVSQSETESALRKGLGERKEGAAGSKGWRYPETVCVRWSSKVVGIEVVSAHGTRSDGADSDDDRVRVYVEGADGVVEQLEARYLVAADGAHSTVRHLLGRRFAGHLIPRSNLASADIMLRKPLSARLGHVLLSMPFADPTVALFFRLSSDPRHFRLIFSRIPPPDDTAVLPPPSDECVQALLHRVLGGATDVEIDEISWSSSYSLHERIVDQYRLGPVFFAGDSAHVHPPLGGQGMNIGILDACGAAWRLAFALRAAEQGKPTPHALLDSYEQERRAVGSAVVRVTDVLSRALVVMPTNPRALYVRFASWLRHFLLATAFFFLGSLVLPTGLRFLSQVTHRYPAQSTAVGVDSRSRVAARISRTLGRSYLVPGTRLSPSRYAHLDQRPYVSLAFLALSDLPMDLPLDMVDMVRPALVPSTDAVALGIVREVILIRPDGIIALVADASTAVSEIDGYLQRLQLR